ncbi:hypothetical protein FM076_25910 [Streptomyces albus subsp. chlorinus]|uniref:hypothetical protein n=1 Tax=Streptomyces albus TaxID=1888 RepID=UPI00156F30F8|nr:hypothetical protein [Streptomyces albus]NSC24401.1 hypothetical protein [Streptomyces albus subsp. chlorinus]
MRTGLLRAVGVATAVYGLAVTARPQLLAEPSGLVDAEGRTAAHTRTSLRPLGLREAACGLALALAPEGAALRTAAWLRLAADLGDAVLLGTTLPRGPRGKAVAVSVGWGALSVVGLYGGGTSGRRPRRSGA